MNIHNHYVTLECTCMLYNGSSYSQLANSIYCIFIGFMISHVQLSQIDAHKIIMLDKKYVHIAITVPINFALDSILENFQLDSLYI